MKPPVSFMQSLEALHPGSLTKLSSTIAVLVEEKLWARILLGMLAGLGFGLVLASYGEQVGRFMNWLVLPAKFFLKLIQMVIVPLIIASVIRGLASTEDANQMKTLGVKFSFFVLATSVLAAALGVVLTTWVAPGAGLGLSGGIQAAGGGAGFDREMINPDMLLNLLPGNPLASIVEGQMLEVVILSLIMGVALISVEPDQARSVLGMLETVQSVCMTIISWAMKLAPYAVFGMIAQVSATTGVKALGRMGLYMGTAFLGFALMIAIYVLVVMLARKHSPIGFLKAVSSPMLLAFSTS
ncbi:MAG: cation:dicarboxylase symporter family transporter, partial [Myxococcales bacterium]|nr:cation:dicarboxylase symporter family transporter [Myxococcales bacterium]